MKFLEVQKVREKYLRDKVAYNLEGDEDLITNLYIVPKDEHLRSSFCSFLDAEDVAMQAASVGMHADDFVYAKTDGNRWDDEYTIFLELYNPKTQVSSTAYVKEYPLAQELIPKEILSQL